MFRLSHLFRTPAPAPVAEAFRFLDPGPLVDGELELVAPHEGLIDAMLASCAHPLTRQLEPEQAAITRDGLRQFLAAAPAGHEWPAATSGRVPSYHFWMRLDEAINPPIPIAGDITLRAGCNSDIELYTGHIGYHVFPAVRGHHYAQRACQLLFPLARRHGIAPLWITTDPENLASRRTCQRLGAILVGIVDVPSDHVLYARGQKRKCRYRIDL